MKVHIIYILVIVSFAASCAGFQPALSSDDGIYDDRVTYRPTAGSMYPEGTFDEPLNYKEYFKNKKEEYTQALDTSSSGLLRYGNLFKNKYQNTPTNVYIVQNPGWNNSWGWNNWYGAGWGWNNWTLGLGFGPWGNYYNPYWYGSSFWWNPYYPYTYSGGYFPNYYQNGGYSTSYSRAVPRRYSQNTVRRTYSNDYKVPNYSRRYSREYNTGRYSNYNARYQNNRFNHTEYNTGRTRSVTPPKQGYSSPIRLSSSSSPRFYSGGSTHRR